MVHGYPLTQVASLKGVQHKQRLQPNRRRNKRKERMVRTRKLLPTEDGNHAGLERAARRFHVRHRRHADGRGQDVDRRSAGAAWDNGGPGVFELGILVAQCWE